MMTRVILLAVMLCVLLGLAPASHAASYYEDERSMGSDTPGLPHYRSPEEACRTGVLQRKINAYQEGDTRQYRYVSLNVGTDDGFAEFACQGVIQRQFFYQSVNWVPVETVAVNVYGPFGANETCTLGGYQDPETGQCGPPKCTDNCCDTGCGNGSNPIGTASGNKHQVETDFLGTGPFPLLLTRTYNSKTTWLANGVPLGMGWVHRYLAQVSIVPPQGSSVLSEAIVYRPDGRILRFNLSGSVWVADPDVSERLTVTEDSSGNYVSATFTTNDDEVERYDQQGRLISITNRGGLMQTLSYTTGPGGSSSTVGHSSVQSVTDPQGHTLTFGYNSTGQLTSVTDGNGTVISYAYDANNNLQTVTYPDVSGTKVRTYVYNESGQTGGVSQPNALTGIQDENTQRFASWGYTSTGLANFSVHGPFSGGTIDKTSIAFNSDGTSSVTDGLGQTRSYSFNVQNLIARYSALNNPCDYCGADFASRSFDTNGYPSSGTDFRGNPTTSSFAANDVNGHPRGLETQRDEAVGASAERITNTTWDANYRVPDQRTVTNHNAVIEARSNWVYNSRGQPTARCDYDLTVSGSGNYVCAASGAVPNGIRRWVYTYCDAVNLSPPGPIGGSGENLALGCPLVGLLRRIDGPRSDVNDWVTYQYYLANDSGAPPKYHLGDLSETVDAAGNATQFVSYDNNGRPTRTQDADGTYTDLSYHPRGWLLTHTIRFNADGTPNSALDLTTTRGYDGVGNLTRLTLPDGAYFTYSFDNAHRLTQIGDGLGNYIAYTLDALGNRTGENAYDPSNTLHRTHSRQFNTLDRMSADINAAGTSAATNFTYDANGNRTNVIAPLARNTVNAFDPLNRLSQMTDPANGITNFSYDTKDNPTLVTDPRTFNTQYTYDGLGDVTQIVSPDTGTTQMTYDLSGNLVTNTDARSALGTYSYDPLNRLTQLAYSDQTIQYGYDAGTNGKGHLTSASDANHSMSWTYDRSGRVTSKSQTIGTLTQSVSYGYTLGNLTSLVTPSGQTITYGYTNHRITSIQVGSTTLLSGATYDPLGPPTGWTWGNNTTVSRSFDQDGNPQQIIAAGVTNTYTVDHAQRITGLSDSGLANNSFTFGYDALDRVTSGVSSAITRGYTYDANGNRLTTTGTNPSTEAVSTTNNRLSSISGGIVRTYSYDAVGNTSGFTGDTFTYNQRGRLATATVASGSTTYLYNALGQLIEKSGNGGTTLLVYDEAGRLLGEYTSSGALVQETIWLDNLPVATLRPNGSTVSIYYVQADHLGTPRKITNPADNSVVWRWDPDTFGSAAPSIATISYTLRFPGQYYLPETGLYYNYYRDYDPATGRYVESDPIGLAGGSYSTYTYVGDNPLSSVDPGGLARPGSTSPSVAIPIPPTYPNDTSLSGRGALELEDLWDRVGREINRCLAAAKSKVRGGKLSKCLDACASKDASGGKTWQDFCNKAYPPGNDYKDPENRPNRARCRTHTFDSETKCRNYCFNEFGDQ